MEFTEPGLLIEYGCLIGNVKMQKKCSNEPRGHQGKKCDQRYQ